MAKNERKPRNAEATRDAIERAARQHFMQKGYDQVGIREIARDAGVDAALISRYFGSKEGLFETAVIPFFNIDMLITGDSDDLASRIAALLVETDPEHKKAFDTNLAFLLSIGNAEVGPKISEALGKTVIAPLAGRLGGTQAEIRAALIVALLVGFDALHRVAHLDVLATADQEILRSKIIDLVGEIARDTNSAGAD